jgi:hypothetical protein
MSVVILSTDGAASSTRTVTRKALAGMPSHLVADDVLAAAGARLRQRDVVIPLGGIRHLAEAASSCSILAADAKASGCADWRMSPHTRTNRAADRRRTIPCPECFAPFFAGQVARADKRQGAVAYVPESHRYVVISASELARIAASEAPKAKRRASRAKASADKAKATPAEATPGE